MLSNITVVVTPLAQSPGRFSARLSGSDRVLVASSRMPFLDAARVLMADGCDPASAIAMRHAGANFDALVSTIGHAAKLTVSDRDRSRICFSPWSAFSSPVGSAPIELNAEGVLGD